MPKPSPAARKVARQVLILALAVFVVTMLLRTLGAVEFDEVVAALRDLSATTLATALGLTAAGYLALVGYDLLALRYLGRRVPLPRLVFASLAAFALQRNIGPGPITGGVVRYRYLRPYGVSAADAVTLTLLCGFCFTLGIVLTGGLALLLAPEALARALRLPAWGLQLAGGALLAGLAGYLYWTDYRRHPIRLRSWQIPPPSIGLSLRQLGLGLADLGLMSGVVYTLLPPQESLSYLSFLGLYVLALVAGAVSHVPGGLGVFESVLALLLPHAATGVVFGALLAFRGIYHLLPLAVMGLVVGVYELTTRFRRRWRRDLDRVEVEAEAAAAKPAGKPASRRVE